MSDRGWIKLHRRIIKSEIYQMPPLYLRVFERLILEANHSDKEIPYKEKGSSVVGKKLIQRGERLTSIRDICEWVGWYERGRFKKPSTKTILNILNWLENNGMIQIYGVKGNRRETHYKVINYGVYQSTDDEVGNRMENSKETVRKQSGKRNKNDTKNDKNDKKKIIGDFTQNPKLITAINDFMEMRTKIKKPMTDRAVELLLGKLSTMADTDEEKIALLEQSTANSWLSVYPLKQDKPQQRGGQQNGSKRRISRSDNRDWEKLLGVD